MSLIVCEISQEYIHRVWKDLEGFLEASILQAKGDNTLDEVKANVIQGSSILYGVFDANTSKPVGALTVFFYNRINDRVAFVTHFGGKSLLSEDSLSQFIGLLSGRGATCIEGAVRKSMTRLLRKIGAVAKSITVHIPIKQVHHG